MLFPNLFFKIQILNFTKIIYLIFNIKKMQGYHPQLSNSYLLIFS